LQRILVEDENGSSMVEIEVR